MANNPRVYQDFPSNFPARWACDWGEDEFGLWMAFTYKGVRQGFRWIFPGTFQMGSPKNKLGREAFGTNETQHEVTLTQGYWLADTACTQALWQAVMENNPSHFQEDGNNPVENVSWNDVQDFMTQLNSVISNLNACLPTEAQWEYACRATSTTPFSFGDNISPEQVNYDGNYPYAGGEKGLYREKTVPVQSLPANAWGLYEMHGNVWEWCQDWYGDYPDHAVIDPTGPTDGSDRVSRGGSWFSSAGNARSAPRYNLEPDGRNDGIGFRLALGQTARPGERRAVIGRTTAAERGGQAKHSTPNGSVMV